MQTPSRSYRYEVLLDFAKEADGAHADLYTELLTYDLYLRERVKSRPAFATDRKLQEAYVWSFYEKEEKEAEYLRDYTEYTAKQTMHMTHLEFFRYPVWDEAILAEVVTGAVKLEKVYAGAILFDYKKRNPLTGNAVEIYPETDGHLL